MVGAEGGNKNIPPKLLCLGLDRWNEINYTIYKLDRDKQRRYRMGYSQWQEAVKEHHIHPCKGCQALIADIRQFGRLASEADPDICEVCEDEAI